MKKLIDEYVAFLKRYIKERRSCGFVEEDFLNICGGIDGFLSYWTGYTYVVEEKIKN